MANIPTNYQRADRMSVNGSIPKNPICVVCRKSAHLCCRRCGDFYCSSGCQNFDWPSHRYICFRMPILVAIEEQYSNKMVDIIPLQDEESYPVQNHNLEQNNKYQQQQQQQHQLKNHYQFPQKPNQAHHLPFPLQQQQQPQQRYQHQAQQQQPQQGYQHQAQQQRTSEQKNKRITSISEYPPQNSKVIITGFKSSNICSIVSAEPNDVQEYKKVIQFIANYGKTAAPLKTRPDLNSYVITDVNGKYSRACVKGSKGAKFRLLLIDFGVEGIRNLTEMREITTEICNLKQHALPVQLRGVPMKPSFGLNGRYLETFKDKEFCIVYEEKQNKNNMRSVELFNIQTNTSLNQLILKYLNKDSNGKDNSSVGSSPQKDDSAMETSSQISTPEEVKESVFDTSLPSSIVSNVSTIRQRVLAVKKSAMMTKAARNPLLNPPFEIQKWKDDENQLDVMIVDTSCLSDGLFGCVKKADLDNLKKVMAFTQNYIPSADPFEPVVSEYCLAAFEDKWYRAKCIGIEDDKFTVAYIDFSNEATLTKDNIRPYPMECTSTCCTVTCAIGEFENLNNLQVEFIKHWGLNDFKYIRIDKIISANDDFYLVEVKELLNKMRSEKLLD